MGIQTISTIPTLMITMITNQMYIHKVTMTELLQVALKTLIRIVTTRQIKYRSNKTLMLIKTTNRTHIVTIKSKTCNNIIKHLEQIRMDLLTTMGIMGKYSKM